MKSSHIKKGFTLLELMIVLLLVSILASFIAPLITVSSASTILQGQAETMRFELQQLASRSWIEGTSFQVSSNNSGEWQVYILFEDEWKIADTLFVMEDDIGLQSYSKELNRYSKKVANGRVAFFSSGEYTPVVITLTKDDASITIEGDGLNEFVVQ